MLLCATTAITADLATALDAWWRFDEAGVTSVADQSGSASTHDGTLNGAASVSALGLCGGAGRFDGGEMNVANHADINLATQGQRTLALWFMADDIDGPGRQLLYEEGGGTRGLNIYIEAGELVVGGWNKAESGWQGTWLRTGDIAADQWHHVVLTLDGGATVEPDAFHAYLDGQRFGSGEGSQLWPHSGDITIGGVGDTLFPSGGSGAVAFHGLIDDFRYYNRTLSAHDIDVLSGQYNEGAAITLATRWRDDLAQFYDLPEVIESVLESDASISAEPVAESVAPAGQPSRQENPAEFATPGVDQAPDTAPDESADQPAPEPAPPDAATAHTENSTDETQPAHAEADDEQSNDEDAPQVTEVPTDGKRAASEPDAPKRGDATPQPVKTRDD